MEQYESGSTAEPGTLRCMTCGFAVSLREDDRVPECPACDGRSFDRAPLFGETAEVDVPQEPPPPAEWLDEARELMDAAGDYLAFVRDDGEIETLPLADGWTRIGRSLSAELRIDDPTVSRRHALIHRDGGTVRLLDDRSLNGVFRNGRRVELDELSDGDSITVGRFDLHLLRLSTDRETALA
jgi:FHA domain/Zinc-ribbon containing domain